MFCKVLYAYDWDFCQIQYNYMDEHTQAGREGLEYANSKKIPVVIMEPLRGGKLVNKLPKEAVQAFRTHSAHHSPAQWGFLWLWDQKEVTVVLSGMNSMEMLNENIRTANHSRVGFLAQEDHEMLHEVASIINAKMKVGCTGCRYCMPCPKGVDIPAIFACYNNMFSDGKTEARFEFARLVGVRKEPAFATQCIECGACEKHCPQHIEIRKKLKEADKALRPFPYKIGINIARKFMLEGRKEHKNKAD
jgi:predicted aldo/keto reductase-like oxidoreductase